MEKDEFLEQLAHWLKTRRDETSRKYREGVVAWDTIDRLLDDVREAIHLGTTPWEEDTRND